MDRERTSHINSTVSHLQGCPSLGDTHEVTHPSQRARPNHLKMRHENRKGGSFIPWLYLKRYPKKIFRDEHEDAHMGCSLQLCTILKNWNWTKWSRRGLRKSGHIHVGCWGRSPPVGGTSYLGEAPNTARKKDGQSWREDSVSAQMATRLQVHRWRLFLLSASQFSPNFLQLACMTFVIRLQKSTKCHLLFS